MPVPAHLSTSCYEFGLAELASRPQGQAATVSAMEIPSVLFVCVHNAGRSQMAASLLEHHAMGRVEVRSAGSAPGDTINPVAVQALADWGLDMSSAEPKVLTDAAVEASDVVITMGCGDVCPIYAGKRYLDWELTDPAGLAIEDVRPVRDEIDRRIRGLLAELLD